jgi:hypothetical protein
MDISFPFPYEIREIVIEYYCPLDTLNVLEKIKTIRKYYKNKNFDKPSKVSMNLIGIKELVLDEMIIRAYN